MKIIIITIIGFILSGCLAIPIPHHQNKLYLSGYILEHATEKRLNDISLEIKVSGEDEIYLTTSDENGYYSFKSLGEPKSIYWFQLLPVHSLISKSAAISTNNPSYKIFQGSSIIHCDSYTLSPQMRIPCIRDIYIKKR